MDARSSAPDSRPTDSTAGRLRRRLAWTAVLVMVALGGGGLATAADRPATDQVRPELFARADARAQPWLQDMGTRLRAVEMQVSGLAGTARQVLTLVQRLDPAQLSGFLVEGDEAAQELEAAAVLLRGVRSAPPAGLDASRLGQANQHLLAGIDQAIDAVGSLPATWRGLSGTTRDVSTLLINLYEHESLVFRATSAARDERWQQALDLLAEGRAALAVAYRMRDNLADPNRAGTIDDLLARYADYSDALTNLYTAIRDGAPLDGSEVTALLSAAERAQAALPDDTAPLRVAVNETAGGALAEAVVAMERARGVVGQAVGGLP